MADIKALQGSTTHSEFDVTFKAPKERVWKTIIEDIASWWPKDFYAGPSAQRFVLEPRLGGRMYEDWGNGAGLIWYTVIAFDPPNSMTLAGHLTPAFGGPAATLLTLTLTESGSNTVLSVSDSVVGRTNEESARKMREGWQFVFGDALRKHAEKK